MSGVTDIKDQVGGLFSGQLNSIRSKVLGRNNEHLDFVMDSFYKLEPQKRTVVVVTIVGLIIGLLLSLVSIYISSINSLQNELNDSFKALHEIKIVKSEYSLQEKRYKSLLKSVERKTKNLNFKPFFEKLVRNEKVKISDLREKSQEMAVDNALHEDLQEVQVVIKMGKISIPRLMSFLVEIEKSNKLLRIQDLAITGLFGNKLYFESKVVVRGYAKK